MLEARENDAGSHFYLLHVLTAVLTLFVAYFVRLIVISSTERREIDASYNSDSGGVNPVNAKRTKKKPGIRAPIELFDGVEFSDMPANVAPEIFYVLNNLKMLELPPQWRLEPKDIKVCEYDRDQYIVRPGDDDDSMYVPVDGTLAVYIARPEGKDKKEHLVKEISKGFAFFSLLSMLDILMGWPSVFKTVSLKALTPSKVAQFSIRSFVTAYKDNPLEWARPIQIVCTRLLHVTMTTLHFHLGLSSELLKPHIRPNAAELTPKKSVREKKSCLKISKLTDKEQAFMDANLEQRMELACKAMASALRLEEPEEWRLMRSLVVQFYEEGDILVEQGSESEQIAIVLVGTVLLKQSLPFEDSQDWEEKWAAEARPFELIGGLQVLTKEVSLYTYKAKTPVYVGVLTREKILKLLEIRPTIFLPIAHSVLSRLSAFVRGVDFALDWILVDRGQAVYRENQIADSLFVVLSGRLRSIKKKTVVEEFGNGDVLGLMELLQKNSRPTTVMAIRFSQLARIPEGLFNYIKMSFPQVVYPRLYGRFHAQEKHLSPTLTLSNSLDSAGQNLRTIAVIPASDDVPLTAFACELYNALSANCRVVRLSSQKVSSFLGSTVLQKMADFRLMQWLNAQEHAFGLVIYECDYAPSNWTRRSLRQADAILVVGFGQSSPPEHALLDEVLSTDADVLRTKKELVLLWPNSTLIPSDTQRWLKNNHFSAHFHVRVADCFFEWRTNFLRTGVRASEQEVVQFFEQNVYSMPRNLRSDIARLARFLTGNAIGLVLSGGGARGAAHVGIIRSLREHHIPIDIVGGTSIGAMISGLYAETPDSALDVRAEDWFTKMCSIWRIVNDLTYPHTAMFTGAGFNKLLYELFGDREIEDLWLPYFCVSTDISTAEMRIHRSGKLWVSARASMSLAGYLPPICDPSDGHYLLDGGYINNLPVDIMRSLGARSVIAVDVGTEDDANLHNYGASLSGTWLLLRKLNPFAEPIRILNMDEVQRRLAFVPCTRHLETVKKAAYCEYIRLQLDAYATADFKKYSAILREGYLRGREVLTEALNGSGPVAEALRLQQSN